MLANILIVDDDDHVRRQLRRLIEMERDLAVCCEAATGKEAVEKHSRDAHVTLMDFNMPGMDGLKASRLILSKCPDASILMVTVFCSTQLCDEARKAGLKGVCSKGESDRILEGINTLLRGETFFPAHIN
ncbi:MAG TPA: response regulator transcription factor [Verrucomicrobiae bacterium]|nr:response regulator transcription factor [Verrucomicrobiae bacterium]